MRPPGAVLYRWLAPALVCGALLAPTAAQAAPPIDQGPGGPILVVTGGADHFGSYYAEILRNEGLDEFDVADVSAVTPAMLDAHQVVLLGRTPLTGGEASMLTTWVNAGGKLIAMRPDAQLDPALGVSHGGGTLSDAYVKVDTSAAPGAGITAATMQFHGVADDLSLNGATPVATLYSDASTATANPAVTLNSVGSQGGQAAAFAYDLAFSVVETRQGNPAWSGQKRDGQAGPIRPDDQFFPDWVDFSKIQIPQADEQQRLLANLIEKLEAGSTPLPRFWYFPHGYKAAVIMTGDDHGNGGTAGRFDEFAGPADSPAGCSVAAWTCVRATSYVFPSTPLTDAQVAAYQAEGFEIALHPDTGCTDHTADEYQQIFHTQLGEFAAAFPSAAAPVTNRNHCIAWNGYDDTAKREQAEGIRLDTNYYYWPDAWIQDRPGLFTGSGMPMRFADVNGAMADVYQAATQMTDESGQSYPKTIDTLLDNAIGANGYYGAFTANMHTDSATSAGADAIVASAKARGVPVVSAKQMLTWLDGRNGSSFGGISYSGHTLSFTIDHAAGADGLEAMIPLHAHGETLSAVTRDGSPASFTTQTIKGVEYAFVDAASGSYAATYAPTLASVHDSPELMLDPEVGSEFDGSALPADWTSHTWESLGGGAGGFANVAGGSLTVDGAEAQTAASFVPTRAVDFVATFGGAPFQHVGLSDGFNSAWAIFSTSNTTNQLFARTNNGGATIDTPLSGSLIGFPHHYRIVWNPTTVEFYVDGALVATHNATITTAMSPAASDFNAGGAVLSVDWLHMSPYTSPKVVTSSVLDAGATADWDRLSWNADTPAGTSVAFEFRTGDTPTPDGSWSAFAPVASSGDAVGGHARYAQYRVTLATTDATNTPVVHDVTATYGDKTAPDTHITSGPSGLTNNASASFAFTASEAGSTFECSLDGAAFSTCASPQAYAGLADGSHTFAVRATDAPGNTDHTGDIRSFTVDATAPTISIAAASKPTDPTQSTSAALTFTRSDGTGSGLAATVCRLDGSVVPCTSDTSMNLSGLALGAHTFRVDVDDNAGNHATGDAYTWQVVSASPSGNGPTVTITWPKDGGRYSLFKPIQAEYSCDAPSGIASQSSTPVANHETLPAPSSPSASLAFTATCTDNDGQTVSRTVHYSMETFAQLVEDDNPLAYYRLGEPAGQDQVADSSGNGHDGEAKNATMFSPYGVSGDGDAARHFLGDGGYVYVNGIAAPQNGLTLGGWVMFDDTGDAELLDHGYDAGIYLRDGHLSFRMLGRTITDPGTVDAGQWYFVAGTWRGGRMTLWKATGAPSTVPANLPSAVATGLQGQRPSGISTFYIGYGQDVPWLRGTMDEVFYYRAGLTPARLTELWLADPPARPKAAAPAPTSAPAAPSEASTPAATPAKLTIQSKPKKKKAKAKPKAKKRLRAKQKPKAKHPKHRPHH
jgi:hypothetical protein